MIAFAWIILLAASHRFETPAGPPLAFAPGGLRGPLRRVELVDEDYRIAPADWQWAPLHFRQQAGVLSASFEVRSESGEARLVLMRRQDLDDMPHGALVQVGPGRSGTIAYYIREPGDYALVVDNGGGAAPVDVHVSVWADFGQRGGGVETLPAGRRLTVIVLSFAVFFGIVSWSARRLLRAVRREGG